MAQDYTAIRVTEAAKADAAEAKRDDETWDDFIRRCAETPPPIVQTVPIDEVKRELADAIAPIEERTGRLERLVEDLGGQR